ncbi:MAG: sigma-70 family RNA polymerase sigma factor [Planctomycetes bacterium]|nr:sigma-70 family RNA polymerase sigma factor [Planctomycetota bacterium]MBI3834150.1 sigma-70 family RNA polymerase sigma factor [Planctomycetota bacterium]
MNTTRSSLLERVKQRTDRSAWNDFFHLYWPLLVGFAQSRSLSRADAEDVAQDCMDVLFRTLKEFNYARGKGSFKNYLYTLVIRRIMNSVRRKRPRSADSSELQNLQALETESSRLWERYWLRHHLAYCLSVVETEFASPTLAAFRLYVISDWPVERVCEALEVTANQVYLAKSRVTARLREEWEAVIGRTG